MAFFLDTLTDSITGTFEENSPLGGLAIYQRTILK
jgi:hypothetical protein